MYSLLVSSFIRVYLNICFMSQSPSLCKELPYLSIRYLVRLQIYFILIIIIIITTTTNVIIIITCFSEPHLWQMIVPRLGVKAELKLPAYTTARAMPDLSCIHDLHHSLQQCGILNPTNEARNQTPSSWIPVGFLTC